MTMVIHFLSQYREVESITADLLDKREECPSSPKQERSMSMVLYVHSSVESCAGDSKKGCQAF